MSCGGSARYNANQAVVQAACAEYRGQVSTREAAAKFHELSAAHSEHLRGVKVTAEDRGLTRAELKDITQQAHALARMRLPNAVRELALEKTIAEQEQVVRDQQAHRAAAHTARTDGKTGGTTVCSKCQAPTSPDVRTCRACNPNQYGRTASTTPADKPVDPDPHGKKTYQGYDGTALTEIGAEKAGRREVRVRFDTGETDRDLAMIAAENSFAIEDPSIELRPRSDGQWNAVGSFAVSGYDGQTTEEVARAVGADYFKGAPRHRAAIKGMERVAKLPPGKPPTGPAASTTTTGPSMAPAPASTVRP